MVNTVIFPRKNGIYDIRKYWEIRKNKETVIYTNNENYKDSFLIYNSVRGYNTGVTSFEDKDRYEQQDYTLGRLMKLTNSYIWIHRWMRPYYNADISEIVFHDSISNVGYANDEADTLYQQITIANKIYKNVYYYPVNSSSKSHKKIYFNHTYGLLQYDYNNQTWRLSEIKPER